MISHLWHVFRRTFYLGCDHCRKAWEIRTLQDAKRKESVRVRFTAVLSDIGPARMIGVDAVVPREGFFDGSCDLSGLVDALRKNAREG